MNPNKDSRNNLDSYPLVKCLQCLAVADNAHKWGCRPGWCDRLAGSRRTRPGAESELRNTSTALAALWVCHGAGRRVWQKYFERKGFAYKHWQNNLNFSHYFNLQFWKGRVVHFSSPLLHFAIRRKYLFNIIHLGLLWNCSHEYSDDYTYTFWLLFVHELAWFFTLRHPKWNGGSLSACGYRLNSRVNAHSFPKQVELRREDFQTQLYDMKDLQLMCLTTNKRPNHSLLALYSKNPFAFFNRTLPTDLLGLALGMIKSYAMNRERSSSGPSGYHYKAGGKTAFTIQKKKENTPPKLSTVTRNSFCAVHMVQFPCHHTVFQLPQRDKTMTNKLMGFLLNGVLFLTEKNGSALPV